VPAKLQLAGVAAAAVSATIKLKAALARPKPSKRINDALALS
jgi:hypothetical protein